VSSADPAAAHAPDTRTHAFGSLAGSCATEYSQTGLAAVAVQAVAASEAPVAVLGVVRPEEVARAEALAQEAEAETRRPLGSSRCSHPRRSWSCPRPGRTRPRPAPRNPSSAPCSGQPRHTCGDPTDTYARNGIPIDEPTPATNTQARPRQRAGQKRSRSSAVAWNDFPFHP
jgi:hypothetical protein